ncbi:MAG: response regulator [Armatimonadota bacterium]|nr:response regulator [Armatimonadota bacterium]MCX7778175.1 response regulator [Armatimonadota bacterium]MDW8025652.1 response regulator [Armatimonadota bacterium]
MATVLVVDDEECIRRLLNIALTKAGYDVLTASNGEQGYTIARSVHPDLILLDVNMPDISGVAICKLLKGDPKTSDIEVLLMTGGCLTEEQAMEAGAKKLLRKPFSLRMLVEYINSLFASNRLAPVG